MIIDSSVESLLIFRLGSVGDTVVALPCFRLIKKAFPDTKRFVLTNIPVNHKACALELILQNTGLVDEFIEYPSKSNWFKKIISLRRIIKQNHFTTMVYCHQTRHLFQAWRDFLFFKCCGVKKIIGLSLIEHGFHYRFDIKTRLYESEYRRLARQLNALGEIDWRDPKLIDLVLTTAECDKARLCIPAELYNKPLIACSIGAKLVMKDWGQENWMQLMHALSQLYITYGLIFIGVFEEYTRSQALLDQWQGATANLCGQLSVRESAALLAKATVFIGHDSGPMHLASAVGTPCVAIFSRHAPPGCWFPFGDQHRVIYPIGENIQSISVGEVASAVKQVLRER